MTVHLLKLCVGCDTVQDLQDWQRQRLKELKRARKPAGPQNRRPAEETGVTA